MNKIDLPTEEYVPKEGWGIIYLYTFDDGQRYVGQTIYPLMHRHKQHVRSKKTPMDLFMKDHMYRLELIDEVPLNELDYAEAYYINYFDCLYPKGLNIMPGGSTHYIPEHVRKKMSESSIGRPKSDEARANMSKAKRELYANGWKPAFNGSMLTDESRKKMSESLKKYFKDHGPNMDGLKKYYETHDVWNKGVPCSEEMKQRISNKLKGQKLSDETRRKMSESRKGLKHSQEWKDKVRASSIASGKYIRVRCVETGEIFESMSDAGKAIGRCSNGIHLCIKGKCKTCGGYHWELADNPKCSKEGGD